MHRCAGLGEISKKVGHHQRTNNRGGAHHAGKGALQLALLGRRNMAGQYGLQRRSRNTVDGMES